MTRKTDADWEAIEADYRAGVMSVREIGRKFDISDAAIRKRATANGWTRDLTERVQQAARAQLVADVRTEVRTDNAQCEPANLRTAGKEREIVAAGAAQVVGVVKQHREDIRMTRSLAMRLLSELDASTTFAGELEEMIAQATKDDDSPKRYNAMMKAISLGSRATTIRDISTALKSLVTLERQAHGMDAKDDDAKNKKVPPALHIHTTPKPKPATQEEGAASA